MKNIKYVIVLFCLLCAFPFVACTGKADIIVSSKFEHVNWWISDKSATVGEEVRIAVSADEGYDGSIDVYVNGKQIERSGGYYTFKAEKTNRVEIGGEIYRVIEKVEFMHHVLYKEQDFAAMNDSITVYYATGDVEVVSDYEVDEYPREVGEKKVLITFIGGDHEYGRLADIKVVDKDEYLQYVKDTFLQAVDRDEVQSFLSTDTLRTIYQQDELIYYEDGSSKVWIMPGVYGYVLSENERVKRHFASFDEAVTALKDHLSPDIAIKGSAAETYKNIIDSISSAEIGTDDHGNVVLSVIKSDAVAGQRTVRYTLDNSLFYIISIADGKSNASIIPNGEYNAELPNGVEWEVDE